MVAASVSDFSGEQYAQASMVAPSEVTVRIEASLDTSELDGDVDASGFSAGGKKAKKKKKKKV